MKKFIFVTLMSLNIEDQKINLQLKFESTCGDYNWHKGKTRPIKATKQNIKLLRQFASENSDKYIPCGFDHNGKMYETYKVRVKKGKCWLTEHTRYAY